MVKRNYKINIAIFLSICQMFIASFIHFPESEVLFILYSVMMLTIIIIVMVLFYSAVKESAKK